MSPLSTPFDTLLIANRGEIAMRVIRSARALGLRTVAVYSSADADAPHVRAADLAVAIGGPLPAESYLRIAALIAAAQASGAQAVHPGYGFLAENAAFAQACAEAGLVFVGPSPEAIRAMGHKAGAKQRMAAAGVPCIPGYAAAPGDADGQSEARLLAEARRIGWPLMVKATAGGGGRGMRLVADEAGFGAALASARSEARGAFGDDEVLLERALVAPRHIEIQVLADRHGNAIHLGERDCSVQRRHQKVIEEAPSPAVDAALRERMGAAAVAAVRAIAYEGAGTLEFLLDQNHAQGGQHGQFYFMEMNTRLQVEHPVTEAITGLDIVALQLRIAAGEALPLGQADVRFSGHAVELRLCAEDPAAGFMPASGTLALWRPSAALRVEHGLDERAEVPPYYDSMVAKLIAHGASREAALARLRHGLADTVALGVATNQAFLSACLRHPVFAAGGATTAFIAQHGAELLAYDPAARAHALALAALLWHGQHGVPLAHAFTVPLRLAEAGQVQAGTLAHGPGAGCRVVLDCGAGSALAPQAFTLELLARSGADVRYRCNGVAHHAVVVNDGPARGATERGDLLYLHALGRAWCIEDQSRRAALRHQGGPGDGLLRAAMNGRVVALAVAVGDSVAQGATLLTLEAMKMEHVHSAPHAGRIKALHVALGEQVAAHKLLAEIEALPTADTTLGTPTGTSAKATP